MTSHTPGPWHVRMFDGSSWSVDAAGDLMIAQAQQLRPLSTDPKQLERHANARLIAAAPELLGIARRWAALDGGDWHVERHAREKRELLDETRAAIAKATGATP